MEGFIVTADSGAEKNSTAPPRRRDRGGLNDPVRATGVKYGRDPMYNAHDEFDDWGDAQWDESRHSPVRTARGDFNDSSWASRAG